MSDTVKKLLGFEVIVTLFLGGLLSIAIAISLSTSAKVDTLALKVMDNNKHLVTMQNMQSDIMYLDERLKYLEHK